MAIVYPITLPSNGVRKVQIAPRSAVLVTEAPSTFVQQVLANPGMVWGITVTYAPRKGVAARELVAALVSLNGREGTFLFGDTACTAPFGAGGGVPLVNGGGQAGRTLATDGWPAATTVLKAGDWIQLGAGATSRLLMVTKDATTDGGGNVTLDVWPALGQAPADNAPLVLNNTKGVWRLNDPFDWSADEAKIYHGLTFTATEVRT